MSTKHPKADSAGLLRQRRCLAQWLREHALDRLLTEAEAAEGSPAVRPAGDGIVPAGRRFRRERQVEPEVGQIRLLYPAPGTAAARRPIYVALLAMHGSNSFLAAPFGRYSVPGLPGEWRTGLKAMPLRVLCLWNSRVVTAAALRRTWRAGRLQPAHVRKALQVHAQAHGGVLGAAVSAAQVGPPVRHPRDPRLAYQAEEAADLDESLQAAARPAAAAGGTGAAVYEADRPALLLAAESPVSYGRRQKKGRHTARQSDDGRDSP